MAFGFRNLLAAAVATAALGLASAASAASFVPCGSDAGAAVSPSGSCHVLEGMTSGNDWGGDLVGLHDADTWTRIGRLNFTDMPGTHRALTIGSNGGEPRLGGTWSIGAWALSKFDSVVLVFRSVGTTPQFATFEISQLSGAYTSPFFKQGGALLGTKRISLYGGTVTAVKAAAPIPLPAGGLLLISGLLGLGLLRRRQS